METILVQLYYGAVMEIFLYKLFIVKILLDIKTFMKIKYTKVKLYIQQMFLVHHMIYYMKIFVG